MLDRERPSQYALEEGDELQQARPGPERQVERLRQCDPSVDRRRDDSADGLNRREVSGLLPVTVDDERVVTQRGGDEGRDHGGVGVARVLERTEHVEEPEREHRKPERVLIGQCVGLRGQLARRVRAHGEGREILGLRDHRIRAVHR